MIFNPLNEFVSMPYIPQNIHHCVGLCFAVITLTHWGRVMHICIGDLTIIDSNNGLSPGQHQAIIWTNAGMLSIGPLGTNCSEIFITILTFSVKKRFESVICSVSASVCHQFMVHSCDVFALLQQSCFTGIGVIIPYQWLDAKRYITP